MDRHNRGVRLGVAIATLVGLTAPGCENDPASDGDGETGATSTGSSSSDGSSSEADTGADTTEADEPPPTACAEPTDLVGAPTTIAEAVDFINALPHPVTLDCFVERLERPLAINATISTVSLQPAVAGEVSPRVFIFYDGMIMSVAIDGEPGRHLLEFGELIGPTTSIKGEVEFPITDPVAVTEPMERILDAPDNTKCRLCHGGETPTPEYAIAFASDALRFRDDELVELDVLREQHEQCDPAAEPERCRRLDSFFAFGEVVAGDFPPGLQTIYDYD